MSGFDVQAIRTQFPILNTQINGRDLVYLDTGASSQKPECVIQAMDDYYRHQHANVHRGIHELSQSATDAYEATRDKVAAWIGAARREEVIFTRGTTESINLIAQTWGRAQVTAGDRLLVSDSNTMPIWCPGKCWLRKPVPPWSKFPCCLMVVWIRHNILPSLSWVPNW